jgi:hypothetical protein
LRCADQEVLVAGVRRNVADDEIANVDRRLPVARPKTAPAISGVGFLLESGACLHGRLLRFDLLGFTDEEALGSGTHLPLI